MKTWLGECRVVDDRSVIAMCIDVEATMCLVMRVERDGSRVVDVSDGELKGHEAALCFAQARHCSCFEPGLYKLGKYESQMWKDGCVSWEAHA
jgi:hypothetical protein